MIRSTNNGRISFMPSPLEVSIYILTCCHISFFPILLSPIPVLIFSQIELEDIYTENFGLKVNK